MVPGAHEKLQEKLSGNRQDVSPRTAESIVPVILHSKATVVHDHVQ